MERVVWDSEKAEYSHTKHKLFIFTRIYIRKVLYLGETSLLSKLYTSYCINYLQVEKNIVNGIKISGKY